MTAHRRIRVLYCETNVDGTIGGSYYSLLYLVKGLDKSRFAPLVLFYTSHSMLGAFEAAGAETVVWPKFGRFVFAERMPRALASMRPLVLWVQKALNFVHGFVWPTIQRSLFLWRRDVDLVHLNNSILYNHDWMLAARLTGRRCVSHERGINQYYPSVAKYWGRHLDAVICISHAVRASMANAGADSGNLHIIHNGFDPAEVRLELPAAVLREQLGIPRTSEVVAMVGNLKAWKGQETVVRAIDRVRHVHPSVRCLLVGATAPADQTFEDELRNLVMALGLNEHVVFAGFHRNVMDVLMLADVVVHASILPEPFGRVILEAMACRKPVIATKAGGVPEIIDEGRTGLMFPPGDHEALAAAILDLLADRTRAARFGEAGFQRVNERFHIARNAEQTVRLYDQLLGASSS